MAVRITRAGVALTVGIIVVTGLIIGGLFWAKQNGEQARRDDAIKVAEQKLKDQSETDIALNSDNGEQNKEEQGQSEANKEQNSSSSTSSESTSSSSSNTASNQTATELPQTGPAENSLVSLLAIGLVAFAGVSYWRSRRILFDL